MFEAFFVKYKIGLKEIEEGTQRGSASTCIKILGILMIFLPSIIGVIDFLGSISMIFWLGIVCIFLVVAYSVNKKYNQKSELEHRYVDYDYPRFERRKQMLKKIMNEYKIDMGCKDEINSLVELAKTAQSKSDFFESSELSIPENGLIMSILICALTKLIDYVNSNEIVIVVNIIMIIAVLTYSCKPLAVYFIRTAFYPDYFIYEELIMDLKQVEFCKDQLIRSC